MFLNVSRNHLSQRYLSGLVFGKGVYQVPLGYLIWQATPKKKDYDLF